MTTPDNSGTNFGWRAWAGGVLFVVALLVLGISPADSTEQHTACVTDSR